MCEEYTLNNILCVAPFQSIIICSTSVRMAIISESDSYTFVFDNRRAYRMYQKERRVKLNQGENACP